MDNFLKTNAKKILFSTSLSSAMQLGAIKESGDSDSKDKVLTDKVKMASCLLKDLEFDIIKLDYIHCDTNISTPRSVGQKEFEISLKNVMHVKDMIGKGKCVGVSIKPLGKQFEPLGELTFAWAYETFKQQIKLSVDSGAQVIIFEKFEQLEELRAAVIAAKEITTMPLICFIEFGINGKTKNGTDPYVVAHVLKSLGVDRVGTVCNYGADHLLKIVKMMNDVFKTGLCVGLEQDSLLLNESGLKRNAKLLRVENILIELIKTGVILFDMQDNEVSKSIKTIKTKVPITKKEEIKSKATVITSNTKMLSIENNKKYNIGRLNSKSDNTFFNELSKGNNDFVVDKIIYLNSKRYDAIYINIDKNAGKNEFFLADFIKTAQAYINLPFIIETENINALNHALKIYKGVAGVIIDEIHEDKAKEILENYGSVILSKDVLFPM